MNTRIKKALLCFTILFSGIFFWDLVSAQSSDNEKCSDTSLSECEQKPGCEIRNKDIESAAKKLTNVENKITEKLNELQTAIENDQKEEIERIQGELKNDQESLKTAREKLEKAVKKGPECVKKGFLGIGDGEKGFWGIGDGERKARRAANQQFCEATYAVSDSTTSEEESQIKTACKNDARCKWSFGKCKGKAGASTEEYITCEKQGVENCEKSIGCRISPDKSQCLPEGDEIFFEEEYSEFGAYTGPVFGGPGLRAGARIAKQKLDNTISKERSLKKLIIYWTNFALSVTSIIAVIALVYAGILYITDMGDGSNSEKAKKIILYVGIGIIVILGSYAVVNTVMKARFGNEEAAISYQLEKIPEISQYTS